MGKHTRMSDRKAARRKGPKATKPTVQSSATDAEDVLHAMTAAAASAGGRQWRKKSRLLDKKEGLRRASASDQRTASMVMAQRAAAAVAEGSLASPSTEPFTRCFWAGPGDDGAPSAALKLARKALGVRVAAGPACPEPMLAPGASDPRLPAVVRAFFGAAGLAEPTPVQRQAWPALLSGIDSLVVAPTGCVRARMRACGHVHAWGGGGNFSPLSW